MDEVLTEHNDVYFVTELEVRYIYIYINGFNISTIQFHISNNKFNISIDKFNNLPISSIYLYIND